MFPDQPPEPAEGGSASAQQSQPATVADVQRIVSEGQKETERELQRVLKVLSEQLISIAAEHQASALRRNTSNVSALSGQKYSRSASNVSAFSAKKYSRSASEQSTVFTAPSLKGSDGARGDSVQGPRRESWSAQNSSEMQHLWEEGNRWQIANALGFSSFEDKVKPSESPISSTASKRQQQERGFMERVVRSALFENVCGIVILANAVIIGIHANSRAMSHERFCEQTWLDVFLLFQTFFTLEILARIAFTKLDFFFGLDWCWNLFDLFIVMAGIIEEIIQRSIDSSECSTGDIGKGFTAVRAIRVLRLVRMIRVFKTMAIFRDFRVMASSILRCLIPLFWACILLVFIQWVFGVYFVHFVSDHVQSEVAKNATVMESQEMKDLQKHYGSLWLAMYTLFQSVTGGLDWSSAADLLHATGDYHPTFLYIFYIALTTFAVLNVVTGVFVENATKLALHDRELVIQEKLRHRESYIKDALSVFKEADSDGSGMVSFQEFEELLSDARVQAFFSCLELDTVEAQRLFRLMDFDGNGQIEPQEFVAGCMYLKGDAKTMDVAALLLEVRRISEFWGRCMDHLDQQMEQLSARLCKTDDVLSL